MRAVAARNDGCHAAESGGFWRLLVASSPTRSISMKAVWYSQSGPARQVLRYGDQPDPEPAAGEVRVRVQVSGVNPSDVKARAGARGAVKFPFQIPHSDGAGVIDRVGSGVPTARVGERVYVWNAAWNRPMGSCAEFVCLPAEQAVPLPAGIDLALGACIGIPVMTACHALLSDGPVSGMTVLVTGGAGNVGRYAIQLARWSGARILSTVSGEEKGAIARQAGADIVVNYRKENVVERVLGITAGQGVDRIVEVEFGGNLATTKHLLKTGGIMAAYGSMADRTPALPFYELMFKHTTLHMLLVYLLSQSERAAVVQVIDAALRDGALSTLIAARFALDRVAQAHECVESAAHVGHVLIDIA
jgi:NADPH:quinone reductase